MASDESATAEVNEPLRLRGGAHALDVRLPDLTWSDEPPRIKDDSDAAEYASAAEAEADAVAPAKSAAGAEAVAAPEAAQPLRPRADVGYVALPEGGVGLRITLPETTAPGTYEGTVIVAGREQPFIAEVEPLVDLHLEPPLLELSVIAGSYATGRLSAVNAGNVAVELPARQNVGLMDIYGLDRGLGRAWTNDEARGLDRWGVLAEELADSFGGYSYLLISEGAGEIAPGEHRDLEIQLHVNADVPPDLKYFGRCTLAGAPLALRVDVISDPAPTDATPARRTGPVTKRAPARKQPPRKGAT